MQYFMLSCVNTFVKHIISPHNNNKKKTATTKATKTKTHNTNICKDHTHTHTPNTYLVYACAPALPFSFLRCEKCFSKNSKFVQIQQ